MKLYLAPVLLSALVVVSPLDAVAQDEGAARRHVKQGLKLAAAGDTLLAFEQFEKALEIAPDLAEAYYHMGRLYTRRATAVETDFSDRVKAENALLEALRIRPSDPRYLLELAQLRVKQHMKVDAGRLFNRALSQARKQGDPQVLADVHFNLGYIKELEYEVLRDRHLPPILMGPPDTRVGASVDPRRSRYVNQYLDMSADVDDSGRLPKEEMIEHYRAALRYDPSHVAASVRLMGQLLDEYRMGEFMALARRLTTANPERPVPYLYLGLGLHVVGREDEAWEAFEEGLKRLPEDERLAVENLAEVMRRREAEEYLSLTPEEREVFEQRYWQLSDPLYLTDANERRIEHLARVAYADLRYAEPEHDKRGWETDRGIIFLRYGPPQEIATFAAQTSNYGNPYSVGRRSIIWSYGSDGPVFVFRQMPGYRGARFADDYEFIAADVRYIQPAKYDNIPSIPELLELPIQVARFRGAEPDEIAVEIHAALPLVEMSRDLDLESGEFQTGLFVLNSDGEKVIERVLEETLTYAESGDINEYRSWRVVLPPSGMMVAAVETRDQVSWRAAASREAFAPARFPADSLAVSDILVADFIRPLAEDPEGRFDYDIAPNAALEFQSGDPVHIYYEVYGLEPDPEGYASYEVSLQVRVKKIHRSGGLATVLGSLADAWGFTIVGDDRVELQFSREVKLDDRDRVTEYLSLDPQEVPPGEYEIRLRLWDRLGEEMARSSRVFHIVREN
ncbi:MAG: GWxTD domain-containing protein [Gemmatimonadetes bacterium]|uniref:GWxTD domain-containing protein n=1 Tax=Candidatus Kutchimonas denitrificans TaxID=3056748 RepID=A0AAE4Z6K1_9BACT|nr:GWxTD domain-containing protein [Gemmatimonadota bacterium]NIR74705.1 GWxTD domain-containing protein [Candidatus Kutchimonas denitrificans]NIS01455.1 GWxTD domain-containing protein [Gemmatimonadota bacterium]NIT67196.1 GWxTD domain-containing protein [Gemmatimonadota bacterium]NIU52370.1 GWxTD domain-containing protein [Gemmatimonadota bacterium]